MNLKIGVVLFVLAAYLLTTRSTADDVKAKGADRFVGTYVALRMRPGEERHRFVIEKDGEYYRLQDKSVAPEKNPYRHWRFVAKAEGQLADEKEVLGTITFGRLTFEDGKSPPLPVLRVRFCYEQFLLLPEGGLGLAW